MHHWGYRLMGALLHQWSWMHYYIIGYWFIIRCIITLSEVRYIITSGHGCLITSWLIDASLHHQGLRIYDCSVTSLKAVMDALLCQGLLIHHWMHYYIIRGQISYYVGSWMHYYIMAHGCIITSSGLWINWCIVTSSALMDTLLHHGWLIHDQMHYQRSDALLRQVMDALLHLRCITSSGVMDW